MVMNNMCLIDWAAVGSILQGIGTIAGVCAVIWGAFFGANAWKEQKRAERRLEMAERILTATHKSRRALSYVRSPLMMGYELSAAEEKLQADETWTNHAEGRRKRLVTAQAYFNRLNNTKEEQLALEECLPMARALFSEELEKAVEKLRHQFWSIQVDVEAYVDDEHGNDAEFTKQIRRGMYDVKPRQGEINETSAAIANAVEAIERICEPALRLEPLRRSKIASA